MDQLESMRMFVRVAETGSFAKAAIRASSSTAVVSRSVRDLESRLRTRLLNRTTRRVSLTEAGRRYLSHCEQILAHIDLANAEAMGAGVEAAGKLRVHATTSFGQHYLTPLIVDYTRQFPDVSVQLVLAQRMPDMLEENFDVCLVVSFGLKDSGLVSQRIGTTRAVLCASPHYVAESGAPTSIDELAQHHCLPLTMQDNSVIPWIFDGPDGREFRPPRLAPFTVNVAEALAEAIRAGMGIGMLPESVALQGIRNGTLVHVLPQSPLRANNVYALYASRQYIDARIRTFVDFLLKATQRPMGK